MHSVPAAHARAVVLSVFALALRPVNASGRVKFTRVTRRDLYLAADHGLSARDFYAALSVFDDDANRYAVHPTSHARVIRYDIAPIRQDLAKGRRSLAIAAWERIFDEAGVPGADLASIAAGVGERVDTESPLPDTFRPDCVVRHEIPASKRCVKCERVRSSDEFVQQGDRLLARCNPCRAEDAKAWRRANPDKVRRANRWRGRSY